MGLAVEQVGIFVQTGIKHFVLVAFVRNFTHYLLDDVFERHEALRRAVFIDDDRHVDLLVLEIGQQVVDLFGFRDKIGRTN